ncbi:hypothetical protein BJX61DRAFT_477092 [Aspergillus egyptiacus]|nr:hypothetical protein BJX61DRAFT_477092 [Aspergillus egyptiacus]
MSSPAKAKPENLLGLSFSEARLMLLGIICTDNSGKIDFEKLAAIAPYKNVGSASVSYRNAKRKFLDINSKLQGGSATGPATTENQPASTPTPKKTPAKRKKAAAATDSDAATPAGTATTEQEASFPTPTPKRQRKLPAAETTGTMKTTVKMETDGDE